MKGHRKILKKLEAVRQCVKRQAVKKTTWVVLIITFLTALLNFLIAIIDREEAETFLRQKDFFEAGEFLPNKRKYGVILPGDPVSIVKTVNPSVRLYDDHGQTYYEKRFRQGPVDFIRYYFCTRTVAPDVERIVYHFRNPKMVKKAKQLALETFKRDHAEDNFLESLFWQNIYGSGYTVIFSPFDTYEVTKAISTKL